MIIMKIFKRLLIVVPAILVLVIGFVVLSSYFEHRDLIAEEKELYPAPGQLVDVDDGQLHIYAEGEGDNTLVFMSGLGTSSPFYDFKPLFDELTEDNRIVVIERAGYGWSEITSTDRDLDTVLAESRQALAEIGESGPYTLIPHSLAGMEAIYWAQSYPGEVERIVGLDPLIPEYYEQDEDRDNPLSPLVTFLARSGLMRQQEGVCENMPVIEKGYLNDEEMEAACAIFMRRLMTKNMWEEYRSLDDNSQLVLNGPGLEVPFYAFISGQGEELWIDTLEDYADMSFTLDAGHYIHLDETELIGEKITEIIETDDITF